MDHSKFISKKVGNIPPSGIREFFTLVAEMKDAISLSIGEPDFEAPSFVKQACIDSLKRGETSYTDNRGLLELRKEVSKYVERYFGASYNYNEEIIITVGVSEAFDLALRALINPEDKILYHEPCFVSYKPMIELCHGKPICIETKVKEGFSLNAEALQAAWQPGVKALILNFPTNPTGGTCSEKQLEGIAKFAKEKNLMVITDEIYSELTFEGKRSSLVSLPGMQERTILLHGFSKAYAMTGLRVGYVCAPKALTAQMLKIHQYTLMCSPTTTQYGAIEALRQGDQAVEKMKEIYRKRRDYICQRFNAMGLNCHVPKGSFYTFPSIAKTGLSSMEFCKELLKATKVAVVPGSAFGPSAEGFIRATFASSLKELERAADLIENFVQNVSRQN